MAQGEVRVVYRKLYDASFAHEFLATHVSGYLHMLRKVALQNVA